MNWFILEDATRSKGLLALLGTRTLLGTNYTCTQIPRPHRRTALPGEGEGIPFAAKDFVNRPEPQALGVRQIIYTNCRVVSSFSRVVRVSLAHRAKDLSIAPSLIRGCI